MITLSLMVLLTVIGVGLLSLSAISLRTSSAGDANAQAIANARLAIVLAIGELQKQSGDDRRITADASITGSTGQPHLVGVWDSWTPNFISRPNLSAPNYDSQKETSFRSWLASSPNPTELTDRAWADSGSGGDWVSLFTEDRDGFDLSAPSVATDTGGFAWVVSQENTKAKVNVAGPDDRDPTGNSVLQAQARPSLAASKVLQDPDSDWNRRANRVLSFNQVSLDSDLISDPKSAPSTGASYTVHSQGVLSDVVRGGLKVDLNLGFEMSDSDFAKDTWGDTENPFRSPNSRAPFSSASTYKGELSIFRPLTTNAIISNTTNFAPASVADRFYAGGVPTFDHLRSFYRIPHHLYGGSGTPTVAERGPDHVAVKIDRAPGGTYYAPSDPPQGRNSQLSVRPVLNRMVYLLSASLGSDSQVRLVITPIISLWNPYNTALEIEGAVAFPWIDVPFTIDWQIRTTSGTKNYGVSMSQIMGRQFESQSHGRSVDPYFFCAITAGGGGSTTAPIRFEPGEVRVFVPTSPTPVEFIRHGSNLQRTVPMRPVDDASQMNTRGGLAVPMRGGINGTGFDYTVKRGESVSTAVNALNNSYHYFVSLEDSARIKNPSDATRGEAVSAVQVLNFSSAVTRVSSPLRSYDALKTITQPFGVLETYHRVAKQGLTGQAIADLVYTTNPRHASINHLLSAGSFPVAPHYQSTLRAVSSFDGAIQTTSDGRRSFWGPSQSSSGESQLPFFEIPREPMLSLAAFQSADLATSTFSPSNQFANSWASPYLGRNRASNLDRSKISAGVPIYDVSYLSNEALWDSFFFSGAAPRLSPGTSGSPSNAWQNDIASVTRSTEQILNNFVKDPLNQPLANPRMRLRKGGLSDDELVEELLDPAGCTKIASHLMVDGAFNINSTDVEAWVAVLSGMRGQDFEVERGQAPSDALTAFPRFRHPSGENGDNWDGFRALSEGQIRTLAEGIVEQVKLRGPFLSLAEFVNRRVENSDLGRSGAIQTAIDQANFNDSAQQAQFSTNYYPAEARGHINPDTGVGIPGYLTQADVLQSLAPVITPRSDTFTIRGYGEAKDSNGKVIARAWCEAVVQRTPEFLDATDPADTLLDATKEVNQTFGRRYEIVSFRHIPRSEIQNTL
ncbi:hypothetical protein [Luteolibacter marinus]|uniref:hypothetical protein n=1 Tax=Luteolibacter marinus TaxID=2776705 RepID=UPI00186799C8|nr:hypothetical protein [Luteolibacter marinus]